MYLTDIVRSLIDGLDGEFLQGHVLTDDALQRQDGRIDRTVARRALLKLLTGDIQSDASDALHALTGGHLEIVELHAVIGSLLGTGKHEYVIVGDFLLFIGKAEEILIDLIQTLLILYVYTVQLKTILQGCTS